MTAFLRCNTGYFMAGNADLALELSRCRCVCKRRTIDSREITLAIYREKDIFERRNAANDAKKALLERFKSQACAGRSGGAGATGRAQGDPRGAREARGREGKAERQEQLAREAAERAEREAAEEAARLAAEEAAQAEAKAKRSRRDTSASRALLGDEAERKAKRDARYAARKSRKR